MKPKQISKKLSALYGRACLWETRSKRASLQGDLDRAGRNRNKALKLMAQARELERKSLHQSTEPLSNVVAEADKGGI
jgi:hypothetical protein